MSVRNVKLSMNRGPGGGHGDLTELAGRMIDALMERFPQELEKLHLYVTVEREEGKSGSQGTGAVTGSSDPREVISSIMCMHAHGLAALVKRYPFLERTVRDMLDDLFGDTGKRP